MIIGIVFLFSLHLLGGEHGADSVGVGVRVSDGVGATLSCLHSILWISCWILTISWIYNRDITKNWLDFCWPWLNFQGHSSRRTDNARCGDICFVFLKKLLLVTCTFLPCTCLCHLILIIVATALISRSDIGTTFWHLRWRLHCRHWRASTMLSVLLIPFLKNQGQWNFIHTSAMSHPAHCHQLLRTLTYFSRLAEQCLVCAFSFISRTPPPVAA